MSVDFEAFIRSNTELRSTELIPEVKLHLVGELVPLWRATDIDTITPSGEPPFWAFAWIGGQAVTRYILDTPAEVVGKRVFDFATGSGLSAIACAQVGASWVTGSDIDELACAAARMNARANAVEFTVTSDDVVGSPMDEADVIIAGDICYEAATARRVLRWLRDLAEAGKRVLIGDPGRAYFPHDDLECLARYAVPTTAEIEDVDVRAAAVWTFRVNA
jgi:predicted nicotinamide N-methyase